MEHITQVTPEHNGKRGKKAFPLDVVELCENVLPGAGMAGESQQVRRGGTASSFPFQHRWSEKTHSSPGWGFSGCWCLSPLQVGRDQQSCCQHRAQHQARLLPSSSMVHREVSSISECETRAVSGFILTHPSMPSPSAPDPLHQGWWFWEQNPSRLETLTCLQSAWLNLHKTRTSVLQSPPDP